MERPPNAIGALRLLFASLVIVSHSPEMLDGSLRREPLHMLFHTVSSGGLAVDAFFLISGYLIAASYASSAGLGDYFLKRVLRIYPAFVVCALLCLFVVAPFVGADLGALHASGWVRSAYRIVMLKVPEPPGALIGLPYPSLNGSAWSISYEFRCYILVALFGLIGLYRRRGIYLGLATLVVVVNLGMAWPGMTTTKLPGWGEALFGDPKQDIRLLSAFMVGTCFWLYRDTLPLRARYAALATPLLVALMFVPQLAETALILLGGYILFWVAFKATWKPLLTINAKDDISYGIYLYAWPIGALLIWFWRAIPVWVLVPSTFIGAALCGAISWFVVEKPSLSFKGRHRPASRRTEANVAPTGTDGRAPGALRRRA